MSVPCARHSSPSGVIAAATASAMSCGARDETTSSSSVMPASAPILARRRQRARLDRRSRGAVGRGASRSAASGSPPSARAPRSAGSPAGVTPIDAARTPDRARLHRRARALRRRRLPAGVGAAPRRATREEFVSRIKRVRRDGAGRHVDHRRRLGSQPVGRRAAARATGSTRSRRTIRSGSTASTATWRSPTAPRCGRRRHAGDARTSPAARSCATRRGEPTGVLKDNAMALVDRVVPPPSDEMQRPRARRGDEATSPSRA